ncbi:MAG: twin-arginine translocase subunit TatC [Rikenellaceae bacterium]
MSDEKMTNGSIWEHLDELRATIIRVLIVVLVLAAVAFVFKDQLFGFILAPKSDGFVTYRILEQLTTQLNLLKGGESESGAIAFEVSLINTELAQQFLIHVRMSIYAALFLVAPYLLFEVFRFVSPALYSRERDYAVSGAVWSYLLFMMGAAISYYLIFPLTFRFLGTYQVSDVVENQILLSSYIGTLMTLSLMMGVMFELPVLCWFFAKIGVIDADFLRRYRRHAIVLLLLISAIITPTSDVVTLLLVTLPIYLLYEVSIGVVGVSIGNKNN